MKYLVILLSLYSNYIFSKDYTLKWYSFVTILDTITFKDKSVYRIVRSDGSWEDNEGSYGSLKCIGPNKISSNNEVELDVFCEAYDNKGDTFGLNLYRSSEVNAGTGVATYINTSGKYKRFLGQKCTYAITYLSNFEKGFYKHICK
ncbi:MAG: hypothetical protein CBE11_03760 [Rickettsiales bacterium TMED251]|nr:MAG: hypothetical protein CBE11_03760 [Rickettsiales bacterium TMED251]|tara:strand:- start:253 stop:690 length:438 start_codon:yes stop_codon:yes gene_type:complete